MTDHDIDAWASRLRATTLVDAYAVLCKVPDNVLADVAARLATFEGASAHYVLTAGAAASAGNRSAGFVALEDPDQAALREVLEVTAAAVDAGEQSSMAVGFRLVSECSALAERMLGPTTSATLGLACSLWHRRNEQVVLDDALRLARAAPVHADQRGWHLELTARLYCFRYDATGNIADLDAAIAAGAEALTQAPEESVPGLAVPRPTNRLWPRGWVSRHRAFDPSRKLLVWAFRLPELHAKCDPSEGCHTPLASGAEAGDHASAPAPDRATLLSNQADRLQARYLATGASDDLDCAIALGAEGLDHTRHAGPARATRLSNQSARVQLRHQATSGWTASPVGMIPFLYDLSGAMLLTDALRKAAGPAAAGSDRAGWLLHEAACLELLSSATGELHYLDAAISFGAAGLYHDPCAGPARAARLSSQAGRLQARYWATGAPGDLNAALAMSAEAMAVGPAAGPGRARVLFAHVNLLRLRYLVNGARPDLDAAIAVGAEALQYAPAADRAGHMENQASLLQLRFEADGARPDLHAAIALGAEALEHVSAAERAQFLDNQANRLELRYWAEGAGPDLEAAIALGAEALEHPSGGLAKRALHLGQQAHRLTLRYLESIPFGEALLVHAIALGDVALELLPATAPARAGHVTSQAGRLWLRREAEGNRAGTFGAVVRLKRDLGASLSARLPDWWTGLLPRFPLTTHGCEKALVALAREWSAIVASGGGTQGGVLRHARWWMTRLFDLAPAGSVSWEFVAATGRAVLVRAARFATLPEVGALSEADRDCHALSVRAAVEGVTSLTALACVRAGDAPGAVAVAEEGLATVARDQASRIPWELAERRLPELAGPALELRAAIMAATTAGATEGLEGLQIRYGAALDALREALGLPVLVPAGVAELVVKGVAPAVWVLASAEGGVALRLRPDGEVDYLELPALNEAAVQNWHARLHPRHDDDAGPTRAEAPAAAPALRGPRGHQAPVLDTVAEVSAEVDHALGPAGAWLDGESTVVLAAGLLGTLPWQASRPALRLHASATLAAVPVPARRTGPFVVYADAGVGGRLPGAADEAAALADNHRAAPATGPSATLASLAALTQVRILHLALHGTPQPALLFADEAFGLHNVHLLRRLWSGVEVAVLNCCTSAATLPNVRDETLGFATVALAGGAGAVVTALWPVNDRAAATFASEFHRALAEGANAHTALASARAHTAARYPNDATAMAYQLLGRLS